VFRFASGASQQSTPDNAAEKPATASTVHHAAATKEKNTTASGSSKSVNQTHTASTGKRSRKKSGRTRGQQKIDSQRAEQIQTALIREHYLTGEPSGTWNQSSEDAMRRYQSDHGWQTKEVPDSRALIQLGLGPSKDGLLNPESAMTTSPETPKAATLAPAPHSAEPESHTNNDPPSPADSRPASTPAQDSSHPQ